MEISDANTLSDTAGLHSWLMWAMDRAKVGSIGE